MPDHDSTAWLNAKVDEALRNSLEWNRSQRLKLEKLLRRVMKALEGRAEPDLQALAAEIKGALGDE